MTKAKQLLDLISEELRTYYHAGQAKSGFKAGTFFTSSQETAIDFAKQMADAGWDQKTVTEVDLDLKKEATEPDVIAAAKQLGIQLDEPVYVDQLFDPSIEPEAPRLISFLAKKFDHVKLKDGMSAEPSVVVLDPSIIHYKDNK